MKLPLEFNSKWDSTLRVEVLENRPASIGFTENGDNIVLNLWGSILGEKIANASYVSFAAEISALFTGRW